MFGKAVHWREVFLIKKKPLRYLSCEINLIQTRTVNVDGFGAVCIPALATYRLDGIDSGAPLCLIDVCRDQAFSRPDYCFFVKKDGVTCGPNGWVINYSNLVVFEETFRRTAVKPPCQKELFPGNVSAKALII